MVIYVGDARQDVINRIRTNHCNGNVEASSFRRHVAEAKGYKIKLSKRAKGSTKKRIDLPNQKTGEIVISNYIRSGEWRYVICSSYKEAHDFQWFVIAQLNPLLNKICKPWNAKNLHRYQFLLNHLLNSTAFSCNKLCGKPSGPGVYAFYHNQSPRN